MLANGHPRLRQLIKQKFVVQTKSVIPAKCAIFVDLGPILIRLHSRSEREKEKERKERERGKGEVTQSHDTVQTANYASYEQCFILLKLGLLRLLLSPPDPTENCGYRISNVILLSTSLACLFPH